MAEFKLSSFLIAIVLFSMFVVGLAIPYGDLASNYNVVVDNSFNETYNKIQIVDNSSLDIGTDIEGGGDTTFSAITEAGKVILSSARIVLRSFSVVIQLAADVTDDLGLPPIFLTALTTIVLILIVFGIVSLWARFRT